jgi:hypothetical protein
MRAVAVTVAALLALLAGCGGKTGPKDAVADRQAGEAPEPVPAKPTFESEHRRVLELEEDARFSEALSLLRGMESEFSGHPKAKTLGEMKTRLQSERRAALDLPFAVKGLGSESAEVVTAAGEKLKKAGRAGRIFLRKAVLEEDGKAAIEAAKLLVDSKDPGAREALSARLVSRPSEAIRSVFVQGLVKLAEGGGSDVALKDFYELIRDDKKFVYRELAGAICDAFEGRLGRDRALLSLAVGIDNDEEGAYAYLRHYVASALNSGDDVLAAWAADYAAAVQLMVKGLRGSYYEGRAFEKLALEQIDRQIQIPDRKFPYPDGRQDNISIRWTGFVRIETAGKYTFFSASDDGQRLWVDGRQLVNDWNMHGVVEQSGEIELAPGHYPFKVEFMQGGGGASIVVSWQGPGIPKQVIPESALLTVPWAGMK